MSSKSSNFCPRSGNPGSGRLSMKVSTLLRLHCGDVLIALGLFCSNDLNILASFSEGSFAERLILKSTTRGYDMADL